AGTATELAEVLIEFTKHFTCIFVKGNHDEWVRQFITEGIIDEGWCQHGGERTIQGLDELKANNLENYNFISDIVKTSVDFFIDEENNLFIHGGYRSEDGVGNEYNESVYYWDRSLWSKALRWEAVGRRENQQLPKFLAKYNEIFIGHTPVISIGTSKPVNAANVWNLDTGAGHFGYITAMNINTRTYFQSASTAKIGRAHV